MIHKYAREPTWMYNHGLFIEKKLAILKGPIDNFPSLVRAWNFKLKLTQDIQVTCLSFILIWNTRFEKLCFPVLSHKHFTVLVLFYMKIWETLFLKTGIWDQIETRTCYLYILCKLKFKISGPDQARKVVKKTFQNG